MERGDEFAMQNSTMVSRKEFKAAKHVRRSDLAIRPVLPGVI
ncbi:hypothetical protein Poly59_27920 [Rubripirellula reticaptiva]|uniref:Uncharacterized protein n=1 Tax=Rubripirellula reticaptiva TaxID=2528013 RepID=A0A5C6EV88_9BACT|nr:hypothetical protein Poly59_27920 [Rubripirellula reticaptiva]